MAEAQYAHHNTVDPETGYLENKSYAYAFDAPRKKQFIETLVQNGLSLYNTCKALNLHHETLNKHYHNDPAFKADLDAARNIYADTLDGISKQNALNPKSVIERIFQLKSLYPERYADQKTQGTTNITINVDSATLENISKRQAVIEAEIIAPAQITEQKG